MNQREIQRRVDELIAKAESDIEVVFARRLKTILKQIEVMFIKYGNGKDPSYTELNKYNRLKKEFERMAETLNEDYQEIVMIILAANATIYIENYLKQAYLFEMFSGTKMGFTIPTQLMIETALFNPIEFLRLPKILEGHRNEIIRKINIEISQSLIAGEGYWKMTERIKKAVGFSHKKARLVARTEGGRSMSMSDKAVYDKASKYVKMGKVWMSSLDLRVRASHRILDGQKADKEGYFHYEGMKSQYPRMWGTAAMDIQCRCVVIHTINNMLPQYRRGRDYTDAKYQKKLTARVEKYMGKGLDYARALKQAEKEVLPPSKVIDYVTYDEWFKKLAG
ncbi:phage minor head protein [Bacillus sp. JJ722]|uniref:phage minor head protein n=1 Tax=Bacillus sp. JJ722 TaxID=3122973 RepID=UPI003000DEDB